MSAVSLSQADRIAALERFGYTELEAEFLCVAALHGGYFLRRQIAQFFGRKDGGTVTQLVQKAVEREHARASTWRQNIQLYHLCARPFYQALGEGDNRNRRPREWTAIKNKIMGLDFVLAHRNVLFLATEREKVEFFTHHAHVDSGALPAKRYHAAENGPSVERYFVDKCPIFVGHESSIGGPQRASFCFVDEGLVGLSKFETYLAQYRSLFQALPAFNLIYVAASQAHFAGARQVFARFLISNASGSGSPNVCRIDRLLRYFNSRHLYEARQLATMDRTELIALRDARVTFSDAENEALYVRWQEGGDDAVRKILAPERTADGPIRGTFSTCFLEHDYGLFGTFPPR